jgi:hypothetical protein
MADVSAGILLYTCVERSEGVYSSNPFHAQQAFREIQRHAEECGFPVSRSALHLFQRARSGAWPWQLWSVLSRRPRHPFDLKAIEATCDVRGRYDAGLRTVPIHQIRGSAGRCHEFDARFRPLHLRSRGRWVSVALAWLDGVSLPPVDLLKVDDVYFVCDGHHRISVARVLGQKEIEATVRVWTVAGPLPWQAAPSKSRRYVPSAGRWDQQGRGLVVRVSLLLVALGARLVGYGLPAYEPSAGAAGGRRARAPLVQPGGGGNPRDEGTVRRIWPKSRNFFRSGAI